MGAFRVQVTGTWRDLAWGTEQPSTRVFLVAAPGPLAAQVVGLQLFGGEAARQRCVALPGPDAVVLGDLDSAPCPRGAFRVGLFAGGVWRVVVRIADVARHTCARAPPDWAAHAGRVGPSSSMRSASAGAAALVRGGRQGSRGSRSAPTRGGLGAVADGAEWGGRGRAWGALPRGCWRE
jgi:hypothetical protein